MAAAYASERVNVCTYTVYISINQISAAKKLTLPKPLQSYTKGDR